MPDRLALWTSATLMMVDHPLTGVGPGQTLVVAASNPARYVNTGLGMATNNAHNTILLAGAETGIAGAVGALIVNIAIAIAAVRVLLGLRRRRIPAIESPELSRSSATSRRAWSTTCSTWPPPGSCSRSSPEPT